MLRTRFVLPAVLAAALGAWAAGAAHHEKAEAEEAAPVAAESPWDQAKVTELVKDLHAKVVTIRKAERNAPPDTIASGQARARKQLNDNFRMIDRESKHLVRRLEEGQGREETLPLFRRVDQLRLDSAEQLRRMFLPQAAIEHIRAARALLDQIRPYYGLPADARPDLHGPSGDE